MKLLAIFSILLSLLAQSCADPHFLDRTRKDQSILQGIDVSSTSPIAQTTVLISQDLVMNDNNQPLFFGICTGIVISSRAVLTAAHCLDNGFKKMKIIFSTNPREEFREDRVYNVLNAEVHPTYAAYAIKNLMKEADEPKVTTSFKETLLYSDIAMLVVDRDFPPETISMYNFTRDVQNQRPTQATIAGFGKTTPLKDTEGLNYKSINGILKKAEVELKSEPFYSGRIILPQKNLPGACRGDSGSPMLVKEEGTYRLFAMAIGVFWKENSYDLPLEPIDSENECSGFGVYLLLSPFDEWIATTEETLRKSIPSTVEAKNQDALKTDLSK